MAQQRRLLNQEQIRRLPRKKLVDPVRFELTTYSSGGCRAIRYATGPNSFHR